MKKSIICIALGTLLLTCLTGCTNEKDYAEDAIVPSKIIGTWSENYAIFEYFAMDTGSNYTFNEDGTYDLEVCDFDAGNFSYTFEYTFNDGVITTITPYGTDSYNVVRLDDYLMEWQRVGTTFSENTLHTDYMRFKRVNTSRFI